MKKVAQQSEKISCMKKKFYRNCANRLPGDFRPSMIKKGKSHWALMTKVMIACVNSRVIQDHNEFGINCVTWCVNITTASLSSGCIVKLENVDWFAIQWSPAFASIRMPARGRNSHCVQHWRSLLMSPQWRTCSPRQHRANGCSFALVPVVRVRCSHATADSGSFVRVANGKAKERLWREMGNHRLCMTAQLPASKR